MAQQAGPPGMVGGNMAVPPGWTPMGQQQQMMTYQARNAPQSLGIGAGLNAGQRAGFLNASKKGEAAGWLGEHKGAARKVQNRVQPGSKQEGRLQSYMAGQNPYAGLQR